MNIQERAAIFKRLQQLEEILTNTKGAEYSGSEDTLANFKRNAEKLGLSKYQVWFVYFIKHLDSLESAMKKSPFAPGNEFISEPVINRIADMRIYLGLFLCLVEEDMTKLEDLLLNDPLNKA